MSIIKSIFLNLLYMLLMISVHYIPSHAATIKGTIELESRKIQSLNASSYQKGGSDIPEPPPPRAVIYLPGITASSSSTMRTDTRPKKLVQQNTHFHPPILAIKVGEVVSFPNRDNQYHSVFSYSEVKRFDHGRYLKDEEPPKTRFNQPGIVKVYCSIHDWMRATILVLETPFFTHTNKNGNYDLTGVPPGDHILQVHTSNGNRWSTEVSLTENEQVIINFDENKATSTS